MKQFWTIVLAASAFMMIGSVQLYAQAPVDTGVDAATETPETEQTALAAQAEKIAQLERDNLILEAKEEINKSAYSRLEILLAAFAALMTVVILFFALRTKSEAIAEAKKEASKEAILAVQGSKTEFESLVAQTKTELDGLINEAQTSAEESKQRLEKANKRADEIEALVGSIKAKGAEADEGLSKIREAVEFLDERASTQELGEDNNKATEEEKRTLDEAAAESAESTKESWSIDQFKVAIGQARFSEKNWDKVSELSKLMIERFVDDPSAVLFALENRGRAQINRRQWGSARDTYIQGLSLLDRIDKPSKALRSSFHHHLSFAFDGLGLYVDSEKEARKAVEIKTDVDGESDISTLNARHGLVRALYDQGKLDEADQEVRELIRLLMQSETRNESLWRLAQHDLAKLLIDVGDLEGADETISELLERAEEGGESASHSAMLYRITAAQVAVLNGGLKQAAQLVAKVPKSPAASEWLSESIARLAFVRGQIDDALGRADEAQKHFDEASRIYEEIAPVASYERGKLEEYLKSREAD